MEKKQPEQLQYYLLPSANPSSEYAELHNQVFEFWVKTWRDVFQGLKFDDALLVDDFIRQDLITCICSEKNVVGVHLYSFFSLESLAAKSFRYMEQNYPELYFQKLKKMNVQSVMSMEYLTVHPDWRGKRQELPISSILVGLANRVRDAYQIDAAIAPARRDHKVNELAYAFGGECIIANIMNHNVPCDLLANIRGKTHDHPLAVVQNTEKKLWDNRIDAVQKKQTVLRIAA